MSELTRLSDWRARFETAVDAMWRQPFAWGEHDCGPGLAGRMVEAVTGADLAADYRGRYTTAKGALGVMRRAGFDNLGDLVASVLPEIHPSQAKIGDIAAVETDTPFGYALGVVNGERVFVLHPDGIATVDLLSTKRSFKVG
jgi:hypothetical protein